MKDNNKSYKLNIIAFLILIITSIGIISSYPLIKDTIKKDNYSAYENYFIIKGINETSYVLYKDVLEKQNDKALTYDEVYIKSHKELDSYSEFKSKLNNQLQAWDDNLNRSMKNLNYLSYLDDDTSASKTNTSNSLSTLVESAENKDLNDKYGFFMVVHYDKNGEAEITNVHGADEYTVRNIFSEFSFKRSFDSSVLNENEISFNSIKNATFVYAIPKELKYQDNISQILDSSKNSISSGRIDIFVFGVLSIALIIALLIPYNKGKEVLWVNKFFKIPLEINGIVFFFGSIFLGLGLLFFTEDAFRWIFNNSESARRYDFVDRIIGFGINLILWTAILYLVFAGAMLLKYIFKTGLVKYIKENLLTIKILKMLKRNVYKVINYVGDINLEDKSNKFVIKVVGISFLVISFCCIFWLFGIVVAFIFSAVFFYHFKKYCDDIKNKFNMLLQATNKIADGSLDVRIDEDLGLFNPVKENVEKIQVGLKKAVDEEVKSQRMKTELISNVSHDLKTPLTSIITYIDLLKNEDITEEERKSYIDTLDKKSQRLKFLIEDLFEVSKANSRNIKLNLVNVDIVELMRQTEIELDDKIKKSKLNVKNNFPNNKIILNLDSQKTYRVFENLLNNIAKYAMENSRVYVDIIEKEQRVKITLKNMSASEIDFTSDDIVERFFRGDKSRNTEGSGLGLAIAKSFVELQGGTFDIEIDGDLFKVIITFGK